MIQSKEFEFLEQYHNFLKSTPGYSIEGFKILLQRFIQDNKFISKEDIDCYLEIIAHQISIEAVEEKMNSLSAELINCKGIIATHKKEIDALKINIKKKPTIVNLPPIQVPQREVVDFSDPCGHSGQRSFQRGGC